MKYGSAAEPAQLQLGAEALAQWFHHRGIAWSGTVSEFATELAASGLDLSADQPSLNDVCSYMEVLAPLLRDYGVEARIVRTPGMPRRVTLRAIAPEPVTDNTQPAEEFVNGTPSDPTTETPLHEAPVDQTPSVDTQPMRASFESLITRAIDRGSEEAPAHELSPTVAAGTDTPPDSTSAAPGDQPSSPAGSSEPSTMFQVLDSGADRRRGIPLLSAVVALLAAVVLIFFFFRGQAANVPPQVATTTEGASTEPVPAPTESQPTPVESNQKPTHASSRPSAARQPAAAQPDPDPVPNDSSISALLNQAAVEKRASAQYELGMAFAEGRGVSVDHVAAYTWLVLARTNGDTRSEAALRELTPKLSASEVQEIRVELGDMYSHGVGVTPSNVSAYVWFNLAEAAGAKEGAQRKQELESSMSSREISEANSRTSQWLRRHRRE